MSQLFVPTPHGSHLRLKLFREFMSGCRECFLRKSDNGLMLSFYYALYIRIHNPDNTSELRSVPASWYGPAITVNGLLFSLAAFKELSTLPECEVGGKQYLSTVDSKLSILQSRDVLTIDTVECLGSTERIVLLCTESRKLPTPTAPIALMLTPVDVDLLTQCEVLIAELRSLV